MYILWGNNEVRINIFQFIIIYRLDRQALLKQYIMVTVCPGGAVIISYCIK